MHFQYSSYMLPLIAAALLSAWLMNYAWRHRSVIGAVSFAVITLAVVEWTFGYALEIAGADLATKVLWAKIQYFGIVSAPISWLAFALQYTQRERWLTRRNVLLAAIFPIITILLTFTNEGHQLIWTTVGLKTGGPFVSLEVTHGWWFWLHTAYSYVAMLVGTLLIVQKVLRTPQLIRAQAVALLIAALTPWLGNIVYLSGLNPTPFDLTPFAFTLSGAVFAWAIFRFRLLDLVPIARDVVVERMVDGVIVLDLQNRVVDMNPSAAQLLGVSLTEAIGKPAREVATTWPGLTQKYIGVLETQEEFSQEIAGRLHVFELRISPLKNAADHLLGRFLMIHDVTERRLAQDRVRRQTDRMMALYSTTLDLVTRHQDRALLQVIVDRSVEVLDAPYSEIDLVEGDELVNVAFTANQPLLKGDRASRDSARLTWQAVDTRQAVVLDDYAAWPYRRPVFNEIELHAVAQVPIMINDQCVGAFSFGRDVPRYPFDVDQLQMANLLAQLAALVINNSSVTIAEMIQADQPADREPQNS
jgi:PAS domain S-box-containing protein